MKKNLFILMLFATMAYGQNQSTENFFSFPNRQTLDSPRLIVVQHNLFVDPIGKAPNGKPGRQFGYEFTAIMGWGYISPSVSFFPQLEDGYTDLVVTFGTNFHLFNTTAVRYYTGLRLGYLFRGGGTPYPMAGISGGLDVRIITFSDGSSLYIGGELWVDHREDQKDQFYGDSDAHKPGKIFTGKLAQENGKLKIGFRF